MKRIRVFLATALMVAVLAGGCLPAGRAEAATQSELQTAFYSSAFSLEYGDSSADIMRRWEGDLVFWAGGAHTQEDERGLILFLQQLYERVPGLPPVYWTPERDRANITVMYAPLSDLSHHSSAYVEGNWGFVTYYWNEAQEINYLEIVIASDVTGQEDRNHLLMEEIVNGLGLTNDIDTHADSIIYQPWTTVQRLSEFDWQLLNTLYDARLQAGMSWDEVSRALGWGP